MKHLYGDIPESEVFWIEEYYIAVDELLGMPVWIHSRSAAKYLEKGIISKISCDRAEQLNTAFIAKGEWAEKFLEEKLRGRCAVIEDQIRAGKAAA